MRCGTTSSHSEQEAVKRASADISPDLIRVKVGHGLRTMCFFCGIIGGWSGW